MAAHYTEVVTNEPDAVVALYEAVHKLSFGAPDAVLGDARVATRADGTMVGVRKPMAGHEKPVIRTYVAVDDIEAAVKAAADSGAVVAYGPAREGDHGLFAILIHGGVEHGLWQR